MHLNGELVETLTEADSSLVEGHTPFHLPEENVCERMGLFTDHLLLGPVQKSEQW